MSESANEVRRAVIEYLRQHQPGYWRHWFEDIRALDLEGGTLRLIVDEPVKLSYLRQKCTEIFNDAAQAVTGRLLAVQFLGEAEAAEARARRSKGRAAEKARGGDGGIGGDEMVLMPDFSFDNFVVGPGNQLAHAAAQAVTQRPGHTYNPFFIHGGVGLGKTHLLQAICQGLLQDREDVSIHYVSCESFTNQFMTAVQAGDMLRFRDRFRNVDVLVIDDIHFLAQRERTQEEFFHTFNALHQAGKQIILSSDAAPKEIPDLRERLVSRFNSGLVAPIEKPCYETRVAIAKKKAALRGLALADDVAAFLGEKIDTNIRELEGAIVTLQGLSAAAGLPIDLALAHKAFGGNLPRTQPTMQAIIDVVLEYFGVKLTDLLSEGRQKSIAYPRQVAMYLLCQHTRHSLTEIGAFFRRDHSTVIYGRDKIIHLRASHPEVERELGVLEQRVFRGV